MVSVRYRWLGLACAAGIASGFLPAGPEALAAERDDGRGFHAYARPTHAYVNRSCVIDFSELADFTEVDELTGCGVTVMLDGFVDKRTVPDTWSTWGSPPHTEDATPSVLRVSSTQQVTLTLDRASRVTGLEAEPGPFSVKPITVTFLDGKGNELGAITRDVDGEGGARLFAARAKRVRTVVVTSTADFAIAQLRVKPRGG